MVTVIPPMGMAMVILVTRLTIIQGLLTIGNPLKPRLRRISTPSMIIATRFSDCPRNNKKRSSGKPISFLNNVSGKCISRRMVSVGATEQKRILVAKGEGCEDAPQVFKSL